MVWFQDSSAFTSVNDSLLFRSSSWLCASSLYIALHLYPLIPCLSLLTYEYVSEDAVRQSESRSRQICQLPSRLPAEPELASYIGDDGHTEVSHVGDDLTVLWGNLGVLDQFVQVFLCDA